MALFKLGLIYKYKNLGQKILFFVKKVFGLKKYLDKEAIGSKKIKLVKKILGLKNLEKRFLGQTIFWVKKILCKKDCGQKDLGPKNFWLKNR